MTIRDLCDAAVRFSDGTAGNLLLRDIGGPAGATKYLRGVTRMDRIEPPSSRPHPATRVTRRLLGRSARTTSGSCWGTACRPRSDIAVVWPPNKEPLLVAIMSSKSTADAKYDEAVIAEAAAYVVDTLT